MAKKKKQKSKVDYTKLKRAAYELVVIQGTSQKEASLQLGVSEKTMSEWAKDEDWRNLREARQQDYRTDVDNIKHVIRLISKRRIGIETEIQEAQKIGDEESEIKLRKQAAVLGDEISKYGKTLQGIEKDNKYTLGEFINVMDDIFTELRQYDEDLFNKSIQFQQFLIRKKTQELG
ncbi:MAG: hypothetical protein ACK5M0_05465 [Bacteroidales bacterium]